MGWDAVPEGREYNPATDSAAGRIVSPGYFPTVGVRIVEGRDFDSRDVRPNPFVMAINETFARRIRAEGGDPLRARFLVLGNVRQVVAVVRDVKHRTLDGDPGREVYIPTGQAPTFLPGIRPPGARRGSDRAGSTDPRRDLVTQRMKEIAIRVALGAPRRHVIVAVLSDTITYVGFGLAAGVTLAFAAASSIRSHLFGIEPRDAVTLVTACAVVVVAALLAAYLPARRALRVDPIAALRVE